MSNNYKEFNSKKNLILVLALCLIFFLVIIKAYQYLPEKVPVEKMQFNSAQNINKPTIIVAQNEDVEKEKNIVPVKKSLDINLPTTDEIVEEIESLKPIEEEAVELTNEEKITIIIKDAEKYKASKQYQKAIEELQKITTVTNETDMVAKSYEEIARIYATMKRYGTALSYAQKSFNMSPTSEREILLARLYYKTGDMDKATMRVNNVLQRDFSVDR